jgi:hypothetical protein
VDNAVKFMGDQPEPLVQIGFRRDADKHVFYVQDNGIGIDSKYHEKIFGLFDRLDQEPEGTGVGLAIVRRIVELHGGRIWVESEDAGQGTAFCFTLPPASRSTDEERRVEISKSHREKTTKKTAAEKTAVRRSVSKESPVSMGIEKKYLKRRNVCKVTFRLSKTAAPDAKSVCIVGDFNDWNIHANRMKKQKNGGYTIKLELQPGKEYQFRYLIDGFRWENDWNADRYVRSPYGGSDNSVIMV